MCVHPEAVYKNVKTLLHRKEKYKTVYREPDNLPSKAQWVIRNTHYDRPNHDLKTDSLV